MSREKLKSEGGIGCKNSVESIGVLVLERVTVAALDKRPEESIGVQRSS